MVPAASELTAYTLRPSGFMATAKTLVPAATLAGDFETKRPPAPTSYCDTYPDRVDTYTLLPSGLTAAPAGHGHAAASKAVPAIASIRRRMKRTSTRRGGVARHEPLPARRDNERVVNARS